jgi:hypothetical protein
MTTGCNSSPNGDCNDSKTLEQLTLLFDMIDVRLRTIIDKKTQIVIDLQNCAGANNEILENIINKYETVITDDCCEITTNNLQTIIDLLNGLIYGTSCQLEGIIECNIEPSTTTLEVTTTVEPTTTEAAGENSGTFFVSNIAMFPCIETDLPAENEKTLYYEDTFGTGVQMFTDEVGGTILSGYSYIKKLNSLSVYNIAHESGVVGTIAYTCE